MDTLPQRLQKAIVHPNTQPLIDEARLTLEAIIKHASKNENATILMLATEGVQHDAAKS